MKPTSDLFRAADIVMFGVLAALTGCANAPLSQATLDTPVVPVVSAAVKTPFEPPEPTYTVRPYYPTAMKRSGISGAVMVNCLIDENGRMQDIKVVESTDRAFADSALDALKEWTFKPARRDGTAIRMRTNIPIRFTFTEDGEVALPVNR